MTAQPAQWQRPKDHLTTVLERTGLTYRQLDFASRTGRLYATGAAPGSGHYRHWPEAEIQVAALAKRFLDAGIEAKAAYDAARALEDGVVRLGSGLVLLVEEL